MLQTILSLYLQGLLIATVVVILLSVVWFLRRVIKRMDKTAAERQQVLYDLVMINIMTIPIVSFGVVGILVMLQV